jgi:hypothetical protein
MDTANKELLTMFSSARIQLWPITAYRISVFKDFSKSDEISLSTKKTIDQMLAEADAGAENWKATAERVSALHDVIQASMVRRDKIAYLISGLSRIKSIYLSGNSSDEGIISQTISFLNKVKTKND